IPSFSTMIVTYTSTDPIADLNAIKNTRPQPQALIINSITPTQNIAINEAYEVGLAPTTQLVAEYNWPEQPSFWKTVGKNGVGIMYFSWSPKTSALSPIGQDLVKAFGSKPAEWAIWQWDVLLALCTAAIDAKSTDKAKLVAALPN